MCKVLLFLLVVAGTGAYLGDQAAGPFGGFGGLTIGVCFGVLFVAFVIPKVIPDADVRWK